MIADRDGLYVDGCVGLGGHATAILGSLGQAGRLLGLDRDPAAIAEATRRLQPFGRQVELVVERASRLSSVLAVRGIGKVSGVLLDLGISSRQLESDRGFSFARDGVLDLRFNPAEERPAAQQLLAGTDLPTLSRVLTAYGDFPPPTSRRFARQLLARRDAVSLRTVADLRAALLPLIPPPRRARTLARVLQSLRVWTNDELAEVEAALRAASENLRAGGILCVISYHSLEDRLAKRCMQPPPPPPRRELPPPADWPSARFDVLTRRPVRPGAREIASNPRARSARLRAARRK